MNKQVTQRDAAADYGQGAMEPSDLVRRALSGCADAFRELVMLYSPRLLVLLTRRHLGNRADAEDVIQETLLRIFQSLHRYDPRFPFRVWFYTIAYRLSTDRLRKSKRDSRRLEKQAAMTAQASTQPCDVEQREIVQNIWHKAEKILGEYHFSVLWLSLGEELTHKEIAKVLGKNVLSVRVALHRAKKALASCLPDKNREPTTQPIESVDVGVEVS